MAGHEVEPVGGIDEENCRIVTDYLLEQFRTRQLVDKGPEVRAKKRAAEVYRATGEEIGISALQEEAIKEVVPLLGADIMDYIADRLTSKERKMKPKRRI